MGKIESQKEESEDGLNNVDDEINSEINYVRTFDLVKYFESSCQLEYNDLMRIFTQMDNKAQQVVTFSGVMLGFIVTFGKVDNLSYLRTISVWGIVFCIFVIILLMCSIGFSIYSMRVISLNGMPSYFAIKGQLDDVLRTCEEGGEVDDYYIASIIKDKISQWEITLSNLRPIILKKGSLVFISQILCAISLCLLSLISIVVINSFL